MSQEFKLENLAVPAGPIDDGVVSEEATASEEEKKRAQTLQFNGISEAYVKNTTSRLKQGLQYYAAEVMLLEGREAVAGEQKLAGVKVLDMGTGNGESARRAAKYGAEVAAYDAAPKQIKAAIEQEQLEPLGIKYTVAEHPDGALANNFELVSSIMVLPCAVDTKQLGEMFQDAFTALRSGGKLIGETLNPEFKRFDEIACNRRFTKRADGNIQIEFINDEGGVDTTFTDTYFSKTEVEQAATAAGFKSFEWLALPADPQDIEKNGAEFWEDYNQDPFYIGFKAVK